MYLINGQATDTLSAFDRGLHYGDGLFETIAINRQQPLCWREHIARLESGCKRLGIPCPEDSLLQSEADKLCQTADQGVLKIMVTRGEGGRGYRLPDRIQPTRLLALYPWPDYPPEYATKGINIRLCNTRLGRNPQLAGIKHLNRLEQVLARSEWDDPDITEGLVRDTEDNIIEGTMSNLFMLQGNSLVTPDLMYCGVAGVVRHCLLELAVNAGFETSVSTFRYRHLLAADALFLTNSTLGLWPVVKLGDTRFSLHPEVERIRQMLIERNVIVG